MTDPARRALFGGAAKPYQLEQAASKVQRVRYFICLRCGEGGGTLVKHGGAYRHRVCPPAKKQA